MVSLGTWGACKASQVPFRLIDFTPLQGNCVVVITTRALYRARPLGASDDKRACDDHPASSRILHPKS